MEGAFGRGTAWAKRMCKVGEVLPDFLSSLLCASLPTLPKLAQRFLWHGLRVTQYNLIGWVGATMSSLSVREWGSLRTVHGSGHQLVRPVFHCPP